MSNAPATRRSSTLPMLGVVVVAAAIATVVVVLLRGRLYSPVLTTVSAEPLRPNAVARVVPDAPGLEPYAGLGAWLDVFDYSPAYGADGVPGISVADAVDEMEAGGVQTIFVQAARANSRTPGVTEDTWVLAELLLRAHARDMAVVAWYLPLLDGDLQDGSRIDALRRFDALGHGFDGLALDIEAESEPTPEVLATQTEALISLSQLTRALAGEMPVGAIVLPPPLMEDVNDRFWPGFPWAEIAEYYDVWLPMSYWSGRSNASGYGDGYNYNAESTRRIRLNIGDPDAVVHGIGGIGGVTGERDFSQPEILASVLDFVPFAQSLADTGSVGGSIYDWQTQDDNARSVMAAQFATGVASNLVAPPAWPRSGE